MLHISAWLGNVGTRRDADFSHACTCVVGAGIGPSGLGAYHGKWGFETFSHSKAVFDAPTWVDPKIR